LHKNKLIEQWENLKKKFPNIRIKDAADLIGVSEAQLLSTKVDGKKIVKLNNRFESQFHALQELDQVMALTRNEYVVHETKGIYKNISFNSHIGIVLGSNIDLRIFVGQFAYSFAVQTDKKHKSFYSIHFFNKYGKAIHKVYLIGKKNIAEYFVFVDKFRVSNQLSHFKLTNNTNQIEEFNTKIDQKSFLKDWSNLKDTHDFYPLLEKYKVERLHALEIAEGFYTEKIPNKQINLLLKNVVKLKIPIMIFVSSGGVIQIFTGYIRNVKKIGEWLNILDKKFNLHIKEAGIEHSWVVKKPTVDGTVTSFELFDQDRKPIVSIFGKRKPDNPELGSWRKVINDISQTELEYD